MSRLDDELTYYNVLSGLLGRARQQVDRNPHDKQLSELGLPFEKAKKDRRAELGEYIDKIQRALDEAFLLRLVAAFESMAFARVATALGEARRSVEERFSPTLPYARAAAKLVRNELHDLKDIEDLMASYSGSAVGKLKGLREHRNHVAHGGRIGRLSMADTDLAEVHQTLSSLMDAILGHEADDELGQELGE